MKIIRDRTDEKKKVLPITISGIGSVEGTIFEKRINTKCSKIFFFNNEKGSFFILAGRGSKKGNPYEVKEIFQFSEKEGYGGFSLIKNTSLCLFASLTIESGFLKLYSDNTISFNETIEPRFKELIEKAIDVYIQKKEAKKVTVIKRRKGERT